MDKLGAATRESFGGDIDKMMRIRELAAAPEHQGKGYGSALIATANREVTSQLARSLVCCER